MATTTDIQQYLDAFGGDAKAAAKALEEFAATRERRAARAEHQPQGEVLIQVQDLAKTYRVGRQDIAALGGVSLNIHKGEFVALTGPSGSGKSTLLQLIGGLDKPTSGNVLVGDKNLMRLGDREISEFRNRTIGFVFQFFYLQPFLRLRHNLEIAGMPLRTPRAKRRARVNELAEIVGLTDRLHHFPKELSGGQMQRAAIARALLNAPGILLADEPTGNLDSANGKAIIDLFEKIRDEFGTTIVVVTHDPGVAARADREITLRDGVLA